MCLLHVEDIEITKFVTWQQSPCTSTTPGVERQVYTHSSVLRNFPGLLLLTLCASFKVDGAAIFIKMSFTPSATFSSLGHHILVYFMKKSSYGEPIGGNSFRVYLRSIKCLGEKQKILNSSHTWMYHDLLWVPSKSTAVCIMNLKDLNNKHTHSIKTETETGNSFLQLKGLMSIQGFHKC